MTAFNLNDLQEVHRAMTHVWSVRPEWTSYAGDASYEELHEWPQTWSSDTEDPPWLPHWGNFLAPGFPDIANLDDDEVAYELHTSVFQVPEGDLTRIYNIPLAYEHMWTIRLYIRELEDNDLDGTEIEEIADVQEPSTPTNDPMPMVLIPDSSSESEIEMTDDEEDEGQSNVGDILEDMRVSAEAQGWRILRPRELFPIVNEVRIPQQVKENCHEALRILEAIMETDDRTLMENDFVELCNVLKDIHQMRGDQEVET